jgi:tetratricopeptide (TPR) repeat protein
MSAVFICVLASFTWRNETNARLKPHLQSIVITTAIGILLALFYAGIIANQRSQMLELSRVSLHNLNQALGDQKRIVNLSYAYILFLLLFLGWSLTDVRPLPRIRKVARTGLIYFAAVLTAFGAATLIYSSNLRWSEVEATDRWAEQFQSKADYAVAAAICEAAIKATPAAEHQYFFLGKILTEQAVASKDPAQRLALFLKADQVLESGSKLRPIDHSFPFRRGNLFLTRAQHEPDAAKKTELARKAIEFHKESAVLDPGNADLYYRMGFTLMAVLQAADEAYPLLTKSVELDPNVDTARGLLGDAAFYKAISTQNSNERSEFLKVALTNFQAAIKLVGTNDLGATYRYTAALAKTFVELKDSTNAITAHGKALSMAAPTDRWRHEAALAWVFADLNEKTKALDHIQRAIASAPPNEHAELGRLRTRVLSLP